MHENQLTGAIPDGISRLTNLERLCVLGAGPGAGRGVTGMQRGQAAAGFGSADEVLNRCATLEKAYHAAASKIDEVTARPDSPLNAAHFTQLRP